MPSSPIRDRNTRLGLQLFAFYALFYLSFVLVNAFAPQWGEWLIFGGLNLAIVWGFALILLAFLLALAYGLLCIDEREMDGPASDSGSAPASAHSANDHSDSTEPRR